jgi:hypothetical protein
MEWRFGAHGHQCSLPFEQKYKKNSTFEFKKISGIHIHGPYICTEFPVKNRFVLGYRKKKFPTVNKTRNTYFFCQKFVLFV